MHIFVKPSGTLEPGAWQGAPARDLGARRSEPGIRPRAQDPDPGIPASQIRIRLVKFGMKRCIV